MDQITNKVKSQLFAKGVDNMNQLNDIFMVSDACLLESERRTIFIARAEFKIGASQSFQL